MSNLQKLESDSIFLIREAYRRVDSDRLAMLWSMGKDSTVLLWLVRKAFMGRIPFPVIHIDTTYKFQSMYSYRDRMAKLWNLDLRIVSNRADLKAGMKPENGRLKCCNSLKTAPFKQAVEQYNLKALFLAIRRDEHGVRAKERYVSPRGADFTWDYKNQPLEMWNQYESAMADDDSVHLRVHPLLDWTEVNIWEYIAAESIPVIDMYYAKDGKRYRSLGCHPCTESVSSQASCVDGIIAELQNTDVSEREGRCQDKENQATMQKLRALGYM